YRSSPRWFVQWPYNSLSAHGSIVMLRITAVIGWAAVWLLMAVSTAAQVQLPAPVLGTYGHPKPFWDAGGHLGEYGVNAVFIHGASINKETFERAKSEGAMVFAEFATLNGK